MEYFAITTNKYIGLRDLWHFTAGRGTIGQLKTGFAVDAIPTMNYATNSTGRLSVPHQSRDKHS